ncbi:MAG TPA: trypsin-like peptidase domain-containing protein [Fimbriimonadaceae bacterium]|nr:trypsin-like peptidase domain-containing protein [Fimbriimonadaceae bacterium]
MSGGLGLKAVAVIFLVVFAGVFSALSVNRWMEARQAQASNVATRSEFAKDDGSSSPFDFTAAARRVMPSVVSIDTAMRGSGSVVIPTASGSGVVVQSDGYIVTNAHVVRNPRQRSTVVPVDILTVRTSDERGYTAKVVGVDPVSDLAVIKVEAQNLVPATFGDSSKIEVGDWVIAVGNQLGFDNSVSVGVISSKNRWLDFTGDPVLIDAIQTDAAINRGNSGGALCNSKGEVIGINSSIATLAGVSSGVGFAIPSAHVQRIINDLIDHGKVRYAVLGIEPTGPAFTLTDPQDRADLAKKSGTTDVPHSGVAVLRVFPGLPASKAGIREYDVIREINGRPIETNIDYIRAMMDEKPGDEAEIKVWSKGQEKTFKVKLAARG